MISQHIYVTYTRLFSLEHFSPAHSSWSFGVSARTDFWIKCRSAYLKVLYHGKPNLSHSPVHTVHIWKLSCKNGLFWIHCFCDVIHSAYNSLYTSTIHSAYNSLAPPIYTDVIRSVSAQTTFWMRHTTGQLCFIYIYQFKGTVTKMVDLILKDIERWENNNVNYFLEHKIAQML